MCCCQPTDLLILHSLFASFVCSRNGAQAVLAAVVVRISASIKENVLFPVVAPGPLDMVSCHCCAVNSCLLCHSSDACRRHRQNPPLLRLVKTRLAAARKVHALLVDGHLFVRLRYIQTIKHTHTHRYAYIHTRTHTHTHTRTHNLICRCCGM
jgi:hypothetical protein